MKNPTPNKHTYKLIATHALVIAIVTAPYFIYLWGDIYNLARLALEPIIMPTAILAPVVMDQTQKMSMSLLSSTAALVSFVAFAVHIYKKRK